MTLSIMAKRGAATELTDRNWDQEEEPEEVTLKTSFFSQLKIMFLKLKFQNNV